MATRLNPYLMLPGTAREAMQHYASVLGGDLQLHTFAESGGEGDGIMHALLETPDGFTLMGSDLPPGMEAQPVSGISISLSGDDEDRLRRWWDGLSSDGTVHVPLERQMWGDVFGHCSDRFGVSWMVNITTG